MGKEQGLYRGSDEASFVSLARVRKEHALKDNLTNPEFVTPLPVDRGFKDYYSPKFRKRAQEFQDSFELPTNHVEINLPNEVNCINFIPDCHVGSGFTDYNRIEQELDVIMGTPNSYVVFMGDLIDGFFFNSAQMEEMEQTPEQIQYMKAMFRYLSEDKRLLAAVGGDHDLWSKKMGVNPYAEFAEQYEAHYLHGMSYLTLNVGEQEYNVTLAHQLPGSSIYNNTHPQMRAANRHGGAFGSHVVVSAHNHKKGYSRDTVKGFGNQRIDAHYLALGAYKSQDDYSRKRGWPEQQPKEMYGAAVLLRPDQHEVIYQHSIIGAGEEMDRRLTDK